jgi:signal transduction histidine kinase
METTRGRIEGAKLGSVYGDARQLHQLLLNLVSNALKFHQPGVPPIVSIQTRKQGRFLQLIVKDNGIGFAESAAERIFAPFERMDHTYEGCGVGLAIVRRIAERHGGTVCATSTPGEGSRFEVILPIQPV